MSQAHLPTLTLSSLKQRALAPWVLLNILVLPLSGLAENTLNVENTNFLIRQPDIFSTTDYLYDYNRLRLSDYYTSDSYFVTVIGDWVNYAGYEYVNSPDFEYVDEIRPDIAFETRTQMQYYDSGATYLKLHRLYGGYEDDRQRITVGIQKISMGVGRIWTPTDLYNPKNAYALEPDEVFGVLAANYAYAPSDLSVVNAVVSIRKDNSLKYAGRFKGYLDVADVGVDLIYSDETVMVGYELEGNLFETGAEWRSEGGYYRNDPLDTEFFQGILGVDYGFENGVTAVLEGLYSSDTFTFQEILENYESEIINNMVLSNFYLGSTLYYDFTLAISGSFLYIESFNDANSRFVSPALSYTLNDHNVLSLGALLNHGSDDSEFGQYGDSYYFKWSLSY